jgi:Pyruvate/2-oxoacid:ferredoxin oxidoreductase delta subunit/flavodoxin
MIFYYSGCGNSRWVANRLADKMGQILYNIPKELKGSCTYTLKKDEPLGFVFPTYAWRPPQIVRQFIRRLKIDFGVDDRDATKSNKKPYVFMVCTCGDSIGYSDKIFRKILKSRGLLLNAAFSITMPETYINLPGFQLDDRPSEHQKLELANTNLPLIADFLMHGDEEINVVRGKLPWLTSTVVAWLFEKLLITDRWFHVEDSCVSCGKCVEVCPMENIVLDNGRPRWGGKCQNCMACYHYCPENAIQWGRGTKGKGQYHYPAA